MSTPGNNSLLSEAASLAKPGLEQGPCWCTLRPREGTSHTNADSWSLHRNGGPGAGFAPNTLALLGIYLEGAQYYDAVGAAFNAWGGNWGEDPWDANMRREPERARAVVVDLRGCGRGTGRPDYFGWMRCKVVALSQLADDWNATDE
ncbi:hypothetical protein DL769_004008 [Monosporascus sp. CRB-8-3]|nr:hypothetical protein DL769_004008 [Monosporascus sp. CRB-8-3]